MKLIDKRFFLIQILIIITVIERALPKGTAQIPPSHILFLLALPFFFAKIIKTVRPWWVTLLPALIFLGVLGGTVYDLTHFNHKIDSLLGLLKFLMFTCFFLHTYDVCKKFKEYALLQFSLGIVAAGVAAEIIWLLQKYTGIIKPYNPLETDTSMASMGSDVAMYNGSFSWYPLFGAYAALTAILSLGLMYYFFHKKKIVAVGFFFIFCVSVFCNIICGSRGGFVNLLAGLLVFLPLCIINTKKKVYTIGFFSLLLAAAAYYFSSAIEQIAVRNDIAATSSDVTRSILHVFGLKTIISHPIGIGTEGFNSLTLLEHIDIRYRNSSGNATGWQHAHNLYLQIGIIGGWLSCFAFLLLLLIIFFKTISKLGKINVISLSFLAGFLGFLVQGYNDYLIYQAAWMVTFATIFSISTYISNIRSPQLKSY